MYCEHNFTDDTFISWAKHGLGHVFLTKHLRKWDVFVKPSNLMHPMNPSAMQ